ncbi:DUF4113 domain-containing protein [Aeromonas rivipollensis]
MKRDQLSTCYTTSIKEIPVVKA